MEAGDTSLTVVPTQKQPHSQGLVYKSRGKVQPTEVEQGSPGMGSGGSRQLASDRSDQLPGQRNRDDPLRTHPGLTGSEGYLRR